MRLIDYTALPLRHFSLFCKISSHLTYILMHFSQSYDICKMNVKYSPGSEMQVRNISQNRYTVGSKNLRPLMKMLHLEKCIHFSHYKLFYQHSKLFKKHIHKHSHLMSISYNCLFIYLNLNRNFQCGLFFALTECIVILFPIPPGQSLETTCNSLFRVGLSEVPGESYSCCELG